MNPTKIGARPSVVFVVVTWGDQPLFARSVERGQSLWLGERPSDIPIPPFTDPGAERFPLVRFDRSSPVVTVPATAERLALGCGEAVSLKVGDFSLTLTRVDIDRAERRRFRAAGESPRWVAAVAFLLFSSLAVMARSLPSLGLTDAGEIERALAIALSVPTGDREAEESIDLPLYLSRTKTEHLIPIRGIMRCGSEVMGRPEATDVRGRYAVAGPKDNADPHLASSRGGWPPAVALEAKLSRNPGGDRKAPTMPYARETALGRDEESARGKLWGDPVEDANGNDGFGLRGVEGGIAKGLHWGNAEPFSSAPRVVHTGLRVQGALRPSAVTRAVASRFDRFHACYARAREAMPELGGKVELHFEVGPDGKVASSDAKAQSIRDQELTSCLVASIVDLSLPAAPGGSSKVVYPLFLEPGNAQSAPVRPVRGTPPTALPRSCCAKS